MRDAKVRDLARGRLRCLTVTRLLGLVAFAAVAFTSAIGQASPVRIGGIVHKDDPTELEWDVLTDRYDAVFDLGEHGTSFPGPIEEFRRRNSTKPVLFYENVGGVVVDDRFSRCDADEDFFFHSTDPASLRVLNTPSGNFVFFFRDGRAERYSQYYPPLGVDEYVVEVALSSGGAWHALATVPENGGTVYDVFDGGGGPSRVYRVLSRLGDGSLVPYSWTGTAEPAAQVIAGGWIDGQTFQAIVAASVAPENPAQLVLEVDWNRNRVFGEDGERFPATTSVTYGGGLFFKLSGPVPAEAGDSLLGYRFVLDGGSGATAPRSGEAYTTSRYNNRLQYKNGTFLRQPDHPLAETLLLEKLDQARAAGYDGLHLDFLWDTLAAKWTTFADVAAEERAAAEDLPTSMSNLLGSVRRARPDAMVMFNGRYVVTDEDSYWRYLENSSGGDIEFFAFGLSRGATEIDFRSHHSLNTVLRSAHVEGKQVLALAYEGVENHSARLKSLALYLIVTHEKAYYYYTTDSIYRSVDYFPEWDVPLGRPTLEVLPAMPWDPRAELLLSREFENGWVFFSWETAHTIEIDLGRTYYRLSVSGGRHAALGGDGRAIYEPVRYLQIGPKDGAIVVAVPPGDIPEAPVGLTVR